MVQYFIFSDYIWYDISFFQIMAGLNMMMTDEEHEQMVVFDRDISELLQRYSDKPTNIKMMIGYYLVNKAHMVLSSIYNIQLNEHDYSIKHSSTSEPKRKRSSEDTPQPSTSHHARSQQSTSHGSHQKSSCSACGCEENEMLFSCAQNKLTMCKGCIKKQFKTDYREKDICTPRCFCGERHTYLSADYTHLYDYTQDELKYLHLFIHEVFLPPWLRTKRVSKKCNSLLKFALLMISNNEKFNSFVCPGNTAKRTKLRDKFQIVINTCVTKDCPLLSHDPFQESVLQQCVNDAGILSDISPASSPPVSSDPLLSSTFADDTTRGIEYANDPLATSTSVTAGTSRISSSIRDVNNYVTSQNVSDNYENVNPPTNENNTLAYLCSPPYPNNISIGLFDPGTPDFGELF